MSKTDKAPAAKLMDIQFHLGFFMMCVLYMHKEPGRTPGSSGSRKGGDGSTRLVVRLLMPWTGFWVCWPGFQQ
jgi:hypothetical protein